MKSKFYVKCIRWFAGMLAICLIASCEYETIEIELPDPDETVSFSADIVPIFTEGSSRCIACHGDNATPPNLTAQRAYASIVPNLVNLENPELSKIYSYPNSSTSTHSFRSYTAVQAARILTWINQGAKDN
jgi:hypothetical protein